ncbi:hypothetical protein N7497_012378 [Penicillium chrysogenum]|nr:hypothetical protein N7497_012378 [Penicillium chrysogenum]
MSSMITTTMGEAWCCCPVPYQYEIDEAEMGCISKLARMQLEDAKDDMNAAQDGSGDEGDDAIEEDTEGKTSATNGTDSRDDDDVLKEFDMDNYDKEEVDDDGEESPCLAMSNHWPTISPTRKTTFVIPETSMMRSARSSRLCPTTTFYWPGSGGRSCALGGLRLRRQSR